MRSSLRSTTAQTEQIRVVAEIEIIKSVYRGMNYMTMFLFTGLEAVYSNADKCWKM